MGRMKDVNFIQRIRSFYESARTDLQSFLDQEESSLGIKLELLSLHQAVNGFIQDDMSLVQRCTICEDEEEGSDPRVLFAQFNPRRSQRGKGAGRTKPPAGINPVNGNCFLCEENIAWQQCGLELGYRFTVNGDSSYLALCNPFPLARTHMTIASCEHRPQNFIEMGAGRDSDRVKKVVSDLLRIISMAPDFIGFYNGIGAGASIPSHFHFQVFKRPLGQENYPIEKATKLMAREESKPPFVVNNGYPITFIYFNGDREQICGQVSTFVQRLLESCGDSPNLSVNVIATKDHRQSQGSEKNYYNLYLIPRDIDSSLSPGRKGLVGGLEVLGEIVFTEQRELDMYLDGQIDYKYVSRILRAVESRTVYDFLRRTGKTLNL
jgi:hypothetical protein